MLWSPADSAFRCRASVQEAEGVREALARRPAMQREWSTATMAGRSMLSNSAANQ